MLSCRNPDPGPAGPALERIDQILSEAEQLITAGGDQGRVGFGLVSAAGAIAATEPFTSAGWRAPAG